MKARTVVIVQARSGSTRLPGKVLMDLAGRTVLRRVLERCAVIQGLDAVCCAIPDGNADEAVAEEAVRCGAVVTRGPEYDVLERYYRAAREVGAEIIMRVTSDCPLLDPAVASEVLRLVTTRGADYACNNLPRSWPHGLDCEALRFEWLERAAREAILPSEREHVTPYIRNHPRVHRMVLAGPGGDVAEHRWTLDTAEDLLLLRALFERMPEDPRSYDYRYPLAIVESIPGLADLNRGQERDAGLTRSLAKDAVFRRRL